MQNCRSDFENKFVPGQIKEHHLMIAVQRERAWKDFHYEKINQARKLNENEIE